MDDELTSEQKVLLEQKHSDLVRILQSFENLEKSKEWQTLKELVFDPHLAVIDRQLLNESLKQTPDLPAIYRLQGERFWAKKYSKVGEFVESLKKQLEAINKKIK